MRWKWIAASVCLLILLMIIAVFVIASTYDFNELKPQITGAVKAATGRDLSLSGDIDLKIGLTPRLRVADVRFQNASWGSRPEMVNVRRVDIRVPLLSLIRGNIAFEHLVLVEPDILVETDPAGRTNLVFDVPENDTGPGREAKDAKPGKINRPAWSLADLRIENGQLTYRDARNGKTLAVRIENLNARSAGPGNPVTMVVKGALNGTPFVCEGKVGAWHQLADPETAWPLELTVQALDATLGLDGTIRDLSGRTGVDLQFFLKSQHPEKLERLYGKPIPFRGPLELSARLKAPGTGRYHVSDLKAVIGDSRINGSLTADVSGSVPKLSASLASEKLDLRSVLSETGDQPEPEKEKVFSNAPLPVDALKRVDVDATLRLGRLVLQRLSIDDLKLHMVLENGSLRLKPINARIGGGRLTGHLEIKPRRSAAVVTAAVRIDNLDVGRMLRELDITDMLSGRVDAAADVAGQGASVAGLMAGLNGSTRMVMKDGRIANRYIDLLGSNMASGVFRMVNPLAGKPDDTAVNCFLAAFDIKDGLADSKALVLSTDSMNVIGDGHINLKTEALDFSLMPRPREGVAGFSVSLHELTKTFKLGGTLAQPSLGIDPTRTAMAIGKAVGGVALFGPVGLAEVLVGGKSGDENPCFTAIEEIQMGGAQRPRKSHPKKKEP